MTTHALNRINERYGNKFSMEDINILCATIKKGLYIEIVKDFVDRDKITILTKYNNIPLKLIYAPKQNKIVTALPLDVDEYNDYYNLVPNINTNKQNNETLELETLRLKTKFENIYCHKEVSNGLSLEEELLKDTTLFVKNMSVNFVIIWLKDEKEKIRYQIFSRKTLQKKLWHFVINGFKKQNNKLFTNATLLYSKIYK